MRGFIGSLGVRERTGFPSRAARWKVAESGMPADGKIAARPARRLRL